MNPRDERPPLDFDRLIDEAKGRTLDIARELFPNGNLEDARSSGIYAPLNLTRADKSPGSFCIYTTGSRVGGWTDFATGETGGIYDLVAYRLGLGDMRAGRKKALPWLIDFLNFQTAGPRQARPALPEAVKATEREIEDARAEKARGRAQARYLEAQPLITGTPAGEYLKARGVDVQRLGRQPGALRFHPRLYEPETKSELPALIAAVTRWTPERTGFVTIHRTFLAEIGGTWSKAPIADAKKAYSSYRGGAANIWRGMSGRPMNAAPDGDRVLITEGLEDALTAALAFHLTAPERAPRILCAISLANMRNVNLPAACSTVILAADNDGENEAASLAIKAASEAFKGQGRRVLLARAAAGKDLNDQLNYGSSQNGEDG